MLINTNVSVALTVCMFLFTLPACASSFRSAHGIIKNNNYDRERQRTSQSVRVEQ